MTTKHGEFDFDCQVHLTVNYSLDTKTNAMTLNHVSFNGGLPWYFTQYDSLRDSILSEYFDEMRECAIEDSRDLG